MRKNKLMVLSMGLLGALTLGTSVVNAETDAVMRLDTTIHGGLLELTGSHASPFGSVTLRREATSVSASFDGEFIIEDARGTQVGYRLDVVALPFELVGGSREYTLPAGSLTLEPVSGARVVAGLPENAPVINHTTKRAIDNGSITIATAQAGKGMGAYALSFDPDALVLTVDPTTAYIPSGESSARYESTLTWSLVQAP